MVNDVEISSDIPLVMSVEFTAHALKYYEQMRSAGPMSKVFLSQDLPVWLITDYAIGKSILSDSRFCIDAKRLEKIMQRHNPELPSQADTPPRLLTSDAPVHTRLRKLAMKAFTARAITEFSPRIIDIAEELLQGIPQNQSFDISAYLSYPLPIIVICEILGVPEYLRENFKNIVRVVFYNSEDTENFDPEELARAGAEVWGILRELINAKRQNLLDNPPSDFLDELILTRDKDDALSDAELISIASEILVGGFETTVSLINNAIVSLCTHPEIFAIVHKDHARVPTFIEEILRLQPPFPVSLIRFASEAVNIGDYHIETDDLVCVSLLAANHDPQMYSDPGAITLEKNIPHLSFGHGIHFCLGAALARSEAIIAITHLLKHFSHLALAVPESELVWHPSYGLRSLKEVPIIVQK